MMMSISRTRSCNIRRMAWNREVSKNGQRYEPLLSRTCWFDLTQQRCIASGLAEGHGKAVKQEDGIGSTYLAFEVDQRLYYPNTLLSVFYISCGT